MKVEQPEVGDEVPTPSARIAGPDSMAILKAAFGATTFRIPVNKVAVSAEALVSTLQELADDIQKETKTKNRVSRLKAATEVIRVLINHGDRLIKSEASRNVD
jgi:hypothetical protein